MKTDTSQRQASTYYWASWRRVAVIAIVCGVLVFIASLFGGVHDFTELMRIMGIACVISVVAFALLGITFFRLKGDRLTYVNFPSFVSMDSSDITAITLVPRFFFTKKVTAVQIEKRNPGIFPGMLLSRDAFPDATIAALVSHLKRLNPAIMLDDGVQEILQAEGKLEN